MKFVALLAFFLFLGVGAQAAPPRACSDHTDNDSDGLIDYPADPGCDSRKDLDEYNAPASPAVLRTAVVLVNFTNDQSQPYTVEQARSIAFDGPQSVAAFYLEASYGKQTLAGDVLGWLTIPYPNALCDTAAWKQAAASMLGVDLDATYDHVAFVFPHTTACAFSSRAGSFYNGLFDEVTMAHEVGHSFGLAHADLRFCTDSMGAQVPLSLTCTTHSYGDIFDVMGATYRHFNGWEKARVGWLTNYQLITTSGRYTISPLEWEPQPTPQLLLIRRLDGSVFTLEFRQDYGAFDYWNAYDYAVTGVQVRVATAMPWEAPQTGAQTFLLDTHSNPDLHTFDAPLASGESLIDPLGGVTITVISVGTSAVVDVTFG